MIKKIFRPLGVLLGVVAFQTGRVFQKVGDALITDSTTVNGEGSNGAPIVTDDSEPQIPAIH